MIAKISLRGGETADCTYRVNTVKEIHDFVAAQFTDVPGMPQDIDSMTITILREMIQQPDGSYIPNPDFKMTPSPEYP